jgi:Predicted permease, DMT superfamily
MRRPSGRSAGVATQIATVVSINAGSSLAGLALPLVGAPLVVAVRQLVMVAALLPFSRPRLRAVPRAALLTAFALGIDLAVMNLSFYASVQLLGLGTAATIEFLGPMTLAVVLSRRLLDYVCVAVAAVGVVLLMGSALTLDWLGIALAGLAAVSWAGYILLTHRVARQMPALGGVTLASVVSLALAAPLALASTAFERVTLPLVVLLVIVGVLSSALPYSLDTFILRRVSARIYAIVTSLGPAIAAVFGWLVLGESLTPLQAIAIGLVCAAAAVALALQRDVVAPVESETTTVHP